MKIRIAKAALSRAAKSCAGVAAKSGVAAIYESLLIDAKIGKPVGFTATDLETSITTRVEADVLEPGRACIPAAALAALAAKLPEGDATITVAADSTDAIVTAGKGRYKLAGQDPKDFPESPAAEKDTAIELPGARIVEAIGHVIHAASKERMRYALNGVLFKCDGKTIDVVATDGRRLALDVIVAPPGAPSFSAIIGTDGLRQIARIATGAESVRLSSGRSNAWAWTDEEEVVTRLVDGQFPNYRDVLPKGSKSTVTVNRSDLIAALDRSRLVDALDANVVKLQSGDGELRIDAMSPEKETAETISADIAGEDVTIGFAADFLIDALKSGAAAGEKVALIFSGATYPMRINDAPAVQVVMPCNVSVAVPTAEKSK